MEFSDLNPEEVEKAANMMNYTKKQTYIYKD